MTLTESARHRLQRLLQAADTEAQGFRVEGMVGTCRGSTPILKPAAAPGAEENVVAADGIRFFVPEAHLDTWRSATIEYDSSLLGKGLTMTWPHREGCACSQTGAGE